MSEISISCNGNLENLIAKIARDELVIEGKGYQNVSNGIIGIVLYVKGSPGEMIDIFLEDNSTSNSIKGTHRLTQG